MNIVYCGNNIRGEKCLEYITKNGFDVSLVVTHPNPDESNVVYTKAKELGIDTFSPQKINNEESINHIKNYNPDIIILSGYTQIVKKEFINLANTITINLHGGKLPEYRGSAPLNWMMINDEKIAGISIIEVDEGIDTGAILASKEFEIKEEYTINSLVDLTLELFPPMLVDVLTNIKNNTLIKQHQNLEDGCYYPSRREDDGLIIWESMCAKEVYNLVRALQHPYPNAFTFFEDKKVSIIDAKLYKKELIKGIPGKVVLKREDGILVMCKDEALLIETIQFESDEAVYLAKDKFARRDSFRTLRTMLLER